MATLTNKKLTAGDFKGAIFDVGIFMSPVQEMKDRRWKCIFTGVSRRKREG